MTDDPRPCRVAGPGRPGCRIGSAARNDRAARTDRAARAGRGTTDGRRGSDRRQVPVAPAQRAVPTRTRAGAPRRHGSRWARRLRAATAVLSALTLGAAGTGWALYRDVTAGISTTDVIGTGWGGGSAENILLVGVDSRTDAHGRPLPAAVLAQLHSGPDTGVINSDTIIVLHVPSGGGAAVALSIPAGRLRRHPGPSPRQDQRGVPGAEGRGRATAGGRRLPRPGHGGDRVRDRWAKSAGGRGGVADRPDDRPLRRDQLDRLPQPDHRHRWCAGVPAGAGRRPAVRCPVPRRPADHRGRGCAGLRPAAARSTRGRPVPDPAPAGLSGRGGRQGALRADPDRPGQARRAGRRRAVLAGDRLRMGPAGVRPAGVRHRRREPAVPDHPDPRAGEQRPRRRDPGGRARGPRVRRAHRSRSSRPRRRRRATRRSRRPR